MFAQKVPSLQTLSQDDALIDERIAPDQNEKVIFKEAPSAFFGTGLDTYLREREIDTIILTGCSTSGCVRATAVDGMSYGYRVLVPRECVADRDRDAHVESLFEIGKKYGDVVSIGEAILSIKSIRKNN